MAPEVGRAVDESMATDVVLIAGEFSLHHVLMAHGSHPNTTDNRRIGLAIRSIPTTARQTKIRDAAMLVRGVDEYRHFDLMPDPLADLDDAARAVHADAPSVSSRLYTRAPTKRNCAPNAQDS